MTILQAYLSESEGHVKYPDDVEKLKSEIPELKHVAPILVEVMYQNFSDACYFASWMRLNDSMIEEFKRWLDSDV